MNKRFKQTIFCQMKLWYYIEQSIFLQAEAFMI